MTGRVATIMLVAAEASGDVLGGALAGALRHQLGERLRLIGVGGARMSEQGVDSLFVIDDLAILGLVEGLTAYPRVVARVEETVAYALRERPDIVVLIDSWGFSLRVAQRLRRVAPDLPLLKYVAPQVWASRAGRARTLAQTVDGLLTLHVMDAPYFSKFGLPVTFVGTSLPDRRLEPVDPSAMRARIGAGADDRILVALPGSRRSEIARLGRPFGQAITRLAAARPDLHTIIPVAQTVAAEVRTWAAGLPGRIHLVEGEAAKTQALEAATAALACSGSVTTELALAGVPMIVGYRMNLASYLAVKAIATTRYACLLNVVVGKEIVPEFLQTRCTGRRLAAALSRLFDSPGLRRDQTALQDAALDRMGRGREGDPAERAATAVIELMRARPTPAAAA